MSEMYIKIGSLSNHLISQAFKSKLKGIRDESEAEVVSFARSHAEHFSKKKQQGMNCCVR